MKRWKPDKTWLCTCICILHTTRHYLYVCVCVWVCVCVCVCVLPGVFPASHSHPHSRPVRDHAAAAHSSRGLLQPSSCGRGESTPYCLYSQVMHPSPTASSGRRRLWGGHNVWITSYSPKSLLHLSSARNMKVRVTSAKTCNRYNTSAKVLVWALSYCRTCIKYLYIHYYRFDLKRLAKVWPFIGLLYQQQQQLIYVMRLCDIEYVGIDNDWGEITHFQFQQFWLNRKSIIWLMKILSFRVQASSNQRHARPFSDYASPFKAGMLSLMYLVIAQALSVLNTSSTLCHRLPACKLFFPRESLQASNCYSKRNLKRWVSFLVWLYVFVILTISAVWFLLRTALCRAVMPSFVLKSRCAPPLFSTLMSSAHPSSCAASVRGHSVKSKDEQANNIKILLFTVALLLILLRKWICQTEHTHCPLWFLKFSVTLHQNICFGHCDFQLPVVKWLLPVGVKPTYSDVPFASQLLSQTTGHLTGKSSLWLDKHLHKREEISKEHNPALPSVQMAYFWKSIHGHFVVKTERRRKSMREKTN